MKAKDAAKQIIEAMEKSDSAAADKAIVDFYRHLNDEIEAIRQKRNAKCKSAIRAIFVELSGRWIAMAKRVNEHFENQVIHEDGFLMLLEEKSPPLRKMLDL